jgi:hypothetical protein
MQREPRGCTRGEARSGPGAPQLGLIGRNDVSGVANARGNLAADRAGPAPKKSVVGRDCNAGAKSAGFFADAPRSKGSSNPDTHAGASRLAFRRANSYWHFRRQKSWKPLRCQPTKVLGVTDRQCASPIEPAAGPQKSQAGWMGGPSGLDFALLVERELFAQEEILGRERAFGS